MLVGDFNVEPTKIPCLAKGLIWRLLGLWLMVCSPICKRTLDSACGHRRDFMVGCPLAAPQVQSTPLWPASWLPAIDNGRGSMSVEVQRVWEVYDDRLQFMSRQDALLLDESLRDDIVSRAWLVWSGLVLLRLLLLTLISLLGVLSRQGASFSGGVVPCLGLSDLVGIRFGRLVVVLLMFMMLLMSLCIGTLLLLPCLI